MLAAPSESGELAGGPVDFRSFGLAPAGGVVENRSFFGAGGDRLAALPVLVGVTSWDWVSWPVVTRCACVGGMSVGTPWLGSCERCFGPSCVFWVWAPKSCRRVGELCVLPWQALLRVLVITSLSSASRWLCVLQFKRLTPFPFCHREWVVWPAWCLA